MPRQTPKANTQRACPACLCSDSSLLFNVSSREAAQLLVIREGPHRDRHDALVSLIESQWQGDVCAVRECTSCGFGFAAPFVAGNAEFYNLAYPTVAYPSMKWEFTRTIQALRGLSTRNATALDVAAGHGFFLDLCVPGLFKPSNVMATEFNEESASLLRSKGYEARSIDIRSADFDDKRGKLDFIFLFQVIEHLDDVDSLFSRLRELGTETGNIFLAVPNVRWIRHREETGSLKDLPPTHIGRWTPAAFSSIAKRNGLVMTGHEVEPFSTAKFVGNDLLFSHFARSHRPGSIANRARSIKSSNVRRAAEAAEVILMAPRRIRALASGLRSRRELGGAALWVHLTRAT
jgi:SAM-dependent methyltransferase